MTSRELLQKAARRAYFEKQVKVCERAERELKIPNYKRTTMLMDLDSVPELDLDALLTVPLLDFSHDINGIRLHLDRSTYPARLTGCFKPRCCIRKEVKNEG